MQDTAKQPVTKLKTAKTATKPDKVDRSPLERWIKNQPRSLQNILLGIVLVGLFGGPTFLGYFAWIKIPQLWDGVSMISLSGFFAFFGSALLLMLPMLPLLFWAPMNAILHAMAERSEEDIGAQTLKIRETQKQYEEILEGTDDEGLIPLVTFSRLELSEYYQTGNKQMQKSFRYAVLAMWFGFAIISLGVLLLFLEIRNPTPIGSSSEVWLKAIPIISGLVIELVSALFLWIYRSSLTTERYFYNRQVFIHNALLAYRIAKTTAPENSDASKSLIIQSILDFSSNQLKHLPLELGTKVKTSPAPVSQE